MELNAGGIRMSDLCTKDSVKPFLVFVLSWIAFASPSGAGEVGFLPGAPEIRISISGDATDSGFDFDEADLISGYYEEAASIIRRSGNDFEVALSNFETWYPSDYPRLELDRLMSRYPDRQLRLERTIYQPSGSELRYLRIDAYWQDARQLFQRRRGISVARAVDSFVKFDGNESSRVAAATSFNVELKANGDEISYRAMMFWVLDGRGKTKMNLQDRVVPLGRAFVRDVEITSARRLDELPSKPASLSSLEGFPQEKFHECGFALGCKDPFPKVNTGILDHPNQKHSARLDFKACYSCQSSCYTECTPYTQSKDCFEPGPPFLNEDVDAHGIGADSAVAAKNGNTGQCGAANALGCAVEQCFGSCHGVGVGASISWNGYGAGFNYTTSGSALETMKAQDEYEHSCTRVAHPEPPQEGPCSSTNNFRAYMPVSSSIQAKNASAPTVRRASSDYLLDHLDEVSTEDDAGTKVRYLVEEWAVVSASSSGGVTVLNGSSSAYRQAIAGDDEWKGPLRDGERLILVYDAPLHPENSRHTPVPVVQLGAHRLPFEMGDGRVLVRAHFFPEAGHDRVEVIHAYEGLTPDGVPIDLPSFLLDHLEPKFVAGSPHPIGYFAAMEIKQGVIRVLQSDRFLPRCCCDGRFCV